MADKTGRIANRYYSLTKVILSGIILTVNISTVTTKGQATIPEEIRLMLAVQPGDKVIFNVVDQKTRRGDFMIVPTKNIVDELYGSLNPDGKIKYIPLETARKQAGRLLAKKYGVIK